MSLGACSVAVPVRARSEAWSAALGIVVPSPAQGPAAAGGGAAGRRPRHRPGTATRRHPRLTSAQRKCRGAPAACGRDSRHDPHADRTTVAIVGGGPAGLMLVPPARARRHRVRRRRDPRPGERSRRTVRAGILEQDSVRLLVDAGRLRPGAHARATGTTGIDLRFGGEQPPHRLPRRWSGASVLALPADRGLHRPRRRPRPRRRRRALRRHATPRSSTSTTDRPGVRFTDADGAPHEVALRLPRRRRRLRSICRGRSRRASARQYFREYPFAWFGILCEAPAERAGADLQPLRPRLRADQPAHRRPCSGCTSSATPTSRRRRPGRTTGSGTELQARLDANGYTLQRGADHRQDRAAVPQLRPASRCARPPAARRRRRAHRAAHRRQGPQPRARRRPGAGRGARARGRARTTRRCSTTTPSGRWAGSGRRSTSPTG